MAALIGALDQGTTSTRFMVFDAEGREIARHQLEHRQILPAPGLVEHDPLEIVTRVDETIRGALGAAGLTGRDLAAIGVTNQRETTVVWNPRTGRPWHNAIVWQDTRTADVVRRLDDRADWLRARTGLPPSTYFSSTKLQWLLDRVDGLRAAAGRGEAVFGTIDSWVIWNLTGGPDGGRLVTDATNAARTQLMADILGVPVVRAATAETTALGAAYAAGLAAGVWPDTGALRGQWRAGRQWDPQWSVDRRDAAYQGWQKAVARSLDWAET